jgi:alpha-L-arabinofuranosidase
MPFQNTNFVRVVGLCFILAGSTLAGEPTVIAIQTDHPGPRINPAMWGIFFEDINLGADGGLYAELVKNRAFEFPDPLMGWTKLPSADSPGKIEIRHEAPWKNTSPNYLCLTSQETTGCGIANEGFRGMGIKAGETYNFSARIRVVSGTPRLRVELVGSDGRILASTELKSFSSAWEKYSASLRPNKTDAKARLQLRMEGEGRMHLDFVSLFPKQTWKNRPGGLRADMVQMLADLKPGFMRFPGGCIVEGHYLNGRYRWKNTIGALEDRQLLINRWNDEFKHRPAPDYFQSFGLGFFEFFQLCEDIGAEPLPILNCGMACQFNSGELAPLDQIGRYIQDALDLIEFANGPPGSAWGDRRVAMGHRAPFHLKMLGVGNEQWGTSYFERYTLFAKVLKEKHPEIVLISSAGPSPADERFNLAWPKLRELHADIVDEHCYAAPAWFLQNTHRYDNYDRQGPKVFMGEYAAQSVATVSPKNRNNLECALAEAAYMTGLERNADVVRMASYAPLFAHIDGWQWTPDLIWCDNLRVYGTPNYYVQQLFARNRGDFVLPTKVKPSIRTAGSSMVLPAVFATASKEEKSGEFILKLVNPTPDPHMCDIFLEGTSNLSSKASAVVLSGKAPDEENSFDEPTKVAPVSSLIDGVGSHLQYQCEPRSLTVLRFSSSQAVKSFGDRGARHPR